MAYAVTSSYIRNGNRIVCVGSYAPLPELRQESSLFQAISRSNWFAFRNLTRRRNPKRLGLVRPWKKAFPRLDQLLDGKNATFEMQKRPRKLPRIRMRQTKR